MGKKAKTETRENTYVMTMVSRLPRQIVGYDVAFDKSSQRIQKIVDNGPEAEYYCTDGYLGNEFQKKSKLKIPRIAFFRAGFFIICAV